MKYFLIAGEASGDQHAARLMSELKKIDSEAEFECLGGNKMQSEGSKLHIHFQDMAYMGIVPVLMNLHKIRRNLRAAQKALLHFRPDALILIDYPGFNLRMAKFAKQNSIPTIYYISPKIWAWKTSRIKRIKAHVDHMLCILPFEKAFYQKYGYEVHYGGNPVFDTIQEFMSQPVTPEEFREENGLGTLPVVALLPGSRASEVQQLLPTMIETARLNPSFQFIVAGFEGLSPRLYDDAQKSGIKVLFNKTYSLLRISQAAVVASGTATLETTLLGVPQVVCYKMSPGWLTSLLKPYVLKTKFFSLTNLIAEEEVVAELFQNDVTAEIVTQELDQILNDTGKRRKIMKGYQTIEEKLKTQGSSALAADFTFRTLLTKRK
jgi:lipid-A-disaccharide synthase